MNLKAEPQSISVCSTNISLIMRKHKTRDVELPENSLISKPIFASQSPLPKLSTLKQPLT